MKTSSAKAKGRRLQDYIVKILYENYSHLRPGDIRPAIMGEQGRDVKLSPVAEDYIPFDIEAKNQEKLNIWGSLKQAEENSSDDRIPLLVFKRNRSKTYAVIEFEKLMELILE